MKTFKLQKKAIKVERESGGKKKAHEKEVLNLTTAIISLTCALRCQNEKLQQSEKESTGEKKAHEKEVLNLTTAIISLTAIRDKLWAEIEEKESTMANLQSLLDVETCRSNELKEELVSPHDQKYRLNKEAMRCQKMEREFMARY